MPDQGIDLTEARKHFVLSLQATLDGVISPTPYLEIKNGRGVDIRFLNGEPSSPSAAEITMSELDIASLFFDADLLYVGETGVGKSFTIETIGKTVFGEDGFLRSQLSGGVYGQNALHPFTRYDGATGRNILVPESLSRYGLIFFDEINTGDFNDIRQVVEGVLKVDGQVGTLGMPIGDTGRFKKVKIYGAMNPPDGLHTHVPGDMSIAAENRFIKIRYPNGISSAFDSLMDDLGSVDLHDRFWTDFRRKSGFDSDWRTVYPLISDPISLGMTTDDDAREFAMLAATYTQQDPREIYQANHTVAREYGNVELKFSISQDNTLDRIVAAQNQLKHGFVKRDPRKIMAVGRMLSFIRGMKQGIYVGSNVSLDDATVAVGMTLESKAVTGTDYGQLMGLVNDMRSAYMDMHSRASIPATYGFRQAVWQSAIEAGQQKGFTHYINTIRKGIDDLNTPEGSHAQVCMKARIIADLAVLDHFSKEYKSEITAIFNGKGNALEEFGKLYQEKKSMNSAYAHRLPSIIR